MARPEHVRALGAMLILTGCSSPRVEPPAEPPVRPVQPVQSEPSEPSRAGALVFDGPLPRNLLVLSLDTLRRDHVDPYATDGVVRTPFLAARLAEGVRLADHQQCSNWTLHAMSCTLLGHPVEDLGWVPRFGAFELPLPDAGLTLAERLADAGYEAHVASANGYFGPDWNSTQGYGPDLADVRDALGVGRAGLAALPGASAPWLLHLHFAEPHDPYEAPAAYLAGLEALPPIPYDLATPGGVERLDAAWAGMDAAVQAAVLQHLDLRYSAEVRWLDDQLAILWGELGAGGWLDDTLVVFFTDHGEGMFEHGTRDHARQLYREENDAVLAFWAEDLRPIVWTGPTHAVDLVPTVLAALGLDADASLPGAVVGTASPDRARFATTAGFDGPSATVTVGPNRLVYRFDGTLRRFDLAADPGEQVDLHAPGDPESAALWTLLAPVVADLDAVVPDHAAVPPE